jgi:hypothetical protein
MGAELAKHLTGPLAEWQPESMNTSQSSFSRASIKRSQTRNIPPTLLRHSFRIATSKSDFERTLGRLEAEASTVGFTGLSVTAMPAASNISAMSGFETCSEWDDASI